MESVSLADTFAKNEYTAMKAEISLLRMEVSDLSIEIHHLKKRMADSKASFYKGMLVMMYIPCVIAVIIFIIEIFRH